MIAGQMTIAKHNREENHKTAFSLMLEELGDRAIDTIFFNPAQPPFRDHVLRTTWEELVRQGLMESINSAQYRLTAKGWLVGLEMTGTAQSAKYKERLGQLFAAMKRHVKSRTASAIVSLRQLSDESREPEGWIFNVIDSKAGATGNPRAGARWFGGERGRLVEVPVDFNLEPIDITNALTLQHLDRIQELQERLQTVEEDRAQFHCPYCDAPISGVGHQDYPEYHCIVTYESFACGYVTADGGEESPCPYGPHWPTLDEFEFIAKQNGNTWTCHPIPKTARARRVHVGSAVGLTKEDAEERAKKTAGPKAKGR